MDTVRSVLLGNPLVRAGIAASLGVVSHHAYFIHGEHHKSAIRLTLITFLSPLFIATALNRLDHPLNIFQAASTALQIESSFLLGLWSSMLIYRAFFHRLRSFPGPNPLKLSKFAHMAHLGKFDNYKQVDAWHEKYGEFVRTGPSELSIVAPEAVEAILSSRSTCEKSPWYDIDLPMLSMHTTRHRGEHDKRRRAWDRGFSIKALDSYQSRVRYFAESLSSQVKSFGGAPLNASLWFNYYSFDVMGDLAFGKSFDMLKTGEKHFAIELLNEGQKGLGIVGPLPWLAMVLAQVPVISGGYTRWVQYCKEQVVNRKNMKVQEKDIMSWILEAEPMSDDPFTKHIWEVGDSRLIIVAGSDTAAASLTFMFLHLAKDKTLVEKLRKALAGLQREDGSFDFRDLANVDLLNGIMNEVLRLYPPVPSGVYRQTPPEGIMVGDRRIPGDITVSVPNWTMGRSPKAFVNPLEFIPERWFSKPSLILNKTAFAPFALGRWGCVGKNLALMELRTVTAELVMRYDIEFAPNEDGTKLLNDSEDHFTFGLAELMLCFSERK